MEYLVDCKQTNDDAKQPGGSHGLEVPQDCTKQKKIEKRGEMSEQIGNYPVVLTAGSHTMFVYSDLVQKNARRNTNSTTQGRAIW